MRTFSISECWIPLSGSPLPLSAWFLAPRSPFPPSLPSSLLQAQQPSALPVPSLSPFPLLLVVSAVLLALLHYAWPLYEHHQYPPETSLALLQEETP